MRESLGGGLVLRSVETDADVERFAAFGGRIHGGDVEAFARRLLRDHPCTRARHWLLVEDSASGRIVSSLCLIPWRLALDGVELRSGEMGIVGTDPEWRGRGLMRSLVARFDRLPAEGGFDLTHIQGIPYFYRRFGYSYAVPLVPDLRLPLDQIPGGPLPDGQAVRPALPADAPDLAPAYARLTAPLGLAAVRDEPTWRYLLGGETAGEGETWCVEQAGAVGVAPAA